METTKVVDVRKTIEDAKDAITVRRVFGEPYVKNGVTLIRLPASRAAPGAARGRPRRARTWRRCWFRPQREAGGRLRDQGDEVSWRPAVDVNRVIMGAQLVALVALLVARSIVRSRPAARAEQGIG